MQRLGATSGPDLRSSDVSHNCKCSRIGFADSQTKHCRQDMILNLRMSTSFTNVSVHQSNRRIAPDGECPSTGDITVMSAESSFLPMLHDLHSRFPKLLIVLEHLSTAASVDAIEKCGSTVAGTITAHHLSLIVNDWQEDSHCYCKPVAKLPSDRTALLKAAASGNPKFFFGSDSAPHPVTAKTGENNIAAGVFTQPYTTQLVIEALERGIGAGDLKKEDVTVEKLKGFMGGFGRRFYGIEQEPEGVIELQRGEGEILDILENDDKSVQVVPFRRGEKTWSLSWIG